MAPILQGGPLWSLLKRFHAVYLQKHDSDLLTHQASEAQTVFQSQISNLLPRLQEPLGMFFGQGGGERVDVEQGQGWELASPHPVPTRASLGRATGGD